MAERSTPTPGPGTSHPIHSSELEKEFSTDTADVWMPANPTNKSNKKWPAVGRLLLGGLLLLLFLISILFIALIGILIVDSSIIAPGVRVMGVDIGSMTKEEAAAVLSEEWEQKALLMSHEEGVWPAGIIDLGFVLDVSATIDRAHSQGRSLLSLQQLIIKGADIDPVWSLNTTMAETYLGELSEQVARPAVNAGLQIQDGEVIETPPVEGRELDIKGTLGRLQEAPAQVLADGRPPLSMQPVAPEIRDVSQIAQEARRLLSTTVTIQAYDPVRDESLEWAISPSQWGNWLTLELADGEIAWTVDEDAALESAPTWLPALDDGRYFDTENLINDIFATLFAQDPIVKARVFHQPLKHTVQSGETLSSIGWNYGIPYPWIQQANPGSDFLRAGDELIIPSPDEMLPLPVVDNKRVVVSISEQKALVYENGQVKWDWPASTGIDSSPTSPGIFQIQNHESNAYASNWDLWMPNFMGIYRPVPTSDFMNGFHGFPTRNGSTLLWTGDLGHKVTYGCILLSSENAAQLYEWAEDGVVVEVRP